LFEQAPRVRLQFRHRLGCATHDVGDAGVIQVLAIGQVQGRAVLRRQPVQRGLHAQDVLHAILQHLRDRCDRERLAERVVRVERAASSAVP
jgi:hypothetical protein